MNQRPLAALESKLWEAATMLRGTLDASAYRDVVLGVLFLRIAFDRASPVAESVLRLPPQASFFELLEKRGTADFVGAVALAFLELERENPGFEDVFSYARRGLDAERLGSIFDLFAELPDGLEGDVLSGVYEYFLGAFALSEGRRGGEFFTPASLARLLAVFFEAREGTVFDPAAGAGGMFVEIARRAKSSKERGALRFVGQESNERTVRLCKMNLALHGHSVELGASAADSLGSDLHPNLRADFVVANPPFNVREWGASKLATDERFIFGVPPEKSANFAWIQHALARLAKKGRAGVFLSNGSLSSKLRAEAAIRERLVEAGRVEAIVGLPSQLFANTQIAPCLWLLRGEEPSADEKRTRRETLFVDASGLGHLVSRSRRELSEGEIARLGALHDEFRRSDRAIDVEDFARSVTREEIVAEDYVLTPGRYVRAARASAPEDAPSLELLVRRYFEAIERGRALDDEISELFVNCGSEASASS